MGTAPSVARNTVSNFFVQGWSLLLAFATTPYIVRGLGAEGYGVFGAVSVLLGYLSFLDLGFGWGLIKFAAEYHAQGDRRALGAAVATTFVMMTVIGAVVAAGVYASAPWLVAHALNVDGPLRHTAITAVRLSGVTFAIGLIASVFGAALRGLQRFESINALQAIAGALQVGLSLCALWLGYGLVGVCVSSLVVITVSAGVQYGLLMQTGATSAWPRPSFSVGRRIWGFSAYTAVSRLGTQTLYQVEKIVIGVLLPVAALGYYMVPFNLAFKLAGVAGAIGVAVFPAMSGLYAARQRDDAAVLLDRASRYTLCALLPPAVFLLVVGPQFIAAWIGPEFAGEGGLVLRLLVLAFLLNGVFSVDAITLDAAGRPDLTALQVTLAGVTNLVISVPLVYMFGAAGGAVSLCVSMLVLSAGVLRETHRLGLSTSVSTRVLGLAPRPLATMLPLALLLWAVREHLTHIGVVIAVAALFGVAAYTCLVFSALRRDERAGVLSLGRSALAGAGRRRVEGFRSHA